MAPGFLCVWPDGSRIESDRTESGSTRTGQKHPMQAAQADAGIETSRVRPDANVTAGASAQNIRA
jgi:hypothetical protein